MNRTEKQQLIDELHGEFKDSAHAVQIGRASCRERV